MIKKYYWRIEVVEICYDRQGHPHMHVEQLDYHQTMHIRQSALEMIYGDVKKNFASSLPSLSLSLFLWTYDTETFYARGESYREYYMQDNTKSIVVLLHTIQHHLRPCDSHRFAEACAKIHRPTMA